MIFPITELLDEQESVAWVEKYFHSKGLNCPGCGATREYAREFRRHKHGVVDYRCHLCQRTYNLSTGTIFAGSNLEPRRVVLLVRGVGKGEPATVLAEELALSRQCIWRWRKRLHANGSGRLSATALPDHDTETDEMFQHAGEKRGETHRST
jgi:transposase-like protein